jgi:hypothetical protein
MTAKNAGRVVSSVAEVEHDAPLDLPRVHSVEHAVDVLEPFGLNRRLHRTCASEGQRANT